MCLKVKFTIAVEGGNGELGFYLVSDGGRAAYRHAHSAGHASFTTRHTLK